MSFEYDAPVRDAHNELRVRPRDLPTQRLLAHRLTCDPATRVLSFTDYWGTTVDHVGLIFDHEAFDIVAEAAVETRVRPVPESGPRATFDTDEFRLGYAELLEPSAHVRWNERIAELANDAAVGITDAAELIQATVAATRQAITYKRDSTRIGIPLSELVEGGAGVCQDYAHLNIGLLRSLGVPAQYVSGYLFAVDETKANDHADIVSVQTHAWVEAAMPNGEWMAIDPTNDQLVGERHVVIGYGRDYDDVAPVRGVYAGESVPEVDATVEIRRMEPVERTMSSRPRRVRTANYLIEPDLTQQHQQQQQ